MKFLLYELDCSKHKISNIDKPQIEISIIEFFPKLGKLYSDLETERNFRTSFFRIYISLLSFGKTKMYIAIDKNRKILHTSFLIAPNIKYPFLNKNERSIGPCNTILEARGKGIYPYVISYIVKNNSFNKYYLFVRNNNISSIRGITKTNFVICKEKIKSTAILHRFVMCQK